MNPQDSTNRNVRAANKRIVALKDELKLVKRDLKELRKLVNIIFLRTEKKDERVEDIVE